MTDREAREAIVRKIGEYRADWQQFLRELVAIETPTRCAENIRLAAAKIADRRFAAHALPGGAATVDSESLSDREYYAMTLKKAR